MEIKKLSNDQLIENTKIAVGQELSATSLVIEYLQEVQARQLHLKRGFSSLHEFAVKFLGYSDGAAHRRIASLRLTESLPEVKPQIVSGELSLTNAAKLYDFFRSEKKNEKSYSKEQKLEVLTKVQGMSQRQCEQVLVSLSPEFSAERSEKMTPVSATQAEVRFVADSELLKKYEKLKTLLAHKNASGGMAELQHLIVDMALEKLDPTEKKASAQKPTLPRSTRYISPLIKSNVWMRDGGQCSFVDAITKRRCESSHLLQFDHVRPLSTGGLTEFKNLRLLCYAHHRLVTDLFFGKDFVERKVALDNSRKL